jgi:diguanylate cyclase (GGDEF)-like protein/PAS domain S-box-containing protein
VGQQDRAAQDGIGGNGAASPGRDPAAAFARPAEVFAVVSALPDLYVHVGADDVVLGAYGGDHGMHRGEGAAGKAPWDLFPADCGAKLRQAVDLVRVSGRPVTSELAHDTAQGRRHDEVRCVPLARDALLLIVRDISERKRAEEALRRNEAKYRRLYANAPVMLHSIDTQQRIVDVSEYWLAHLGYERDEVIGRPTVDFYSDASRAAAERDYLPQFFRDGEIHDVPLAVRARDGSIVDVLLSASSERDSAGRVQRSITVMTDVTALKSAEVRLREHQEQLQMVLEQAPIVLWAIDRELRYTLSRGGGLAALGLEPGQVVGDSVRDFLERSHVSPAELAQLEYMQRAVDGRPVSFESSVGGRHYLNHMEPLRDAADEVVGAVGVSQDVTEQQAAEEERRDTEEELRARDQQLRQLMANMPGIAYRASSAPPWQDEFIGSGCEELTGYSAEQLTAGRPAWEEIIAPEDRKRLREETDAAFAESRTADIEYRIRAADGRSVWVLDRFDVVVGLDGLPAAVEGLIIDVDDRHLAEDQLAASREELALHSRIAAVFLTSPRSTVFSDVLDVVREALHGGWGVFGYVGDDGDLVVPSVSSDIRAAMQLAEGEVRLAPQRAAESVWGEALRTGRTQVQEHGGSVPEGHVAIEGAVATPIVYQDETIGLFTLANREGGYDEAAVRLLESVAAYTAPVLHEWLHRQREERARRAAEQARHESETLYQTLYRDTPMGVLVYDTDLRVIDCNDRFLEITGADRETFIHATIDLMRDKRPIEAAYATLEGREGAYEGPYVATASGEELWVSLKTRPRRDAEGRLIGGMLVVDDRTKIKAREREMQHLLLHDTVTGLPNRTLFNDRLEAATGHAQRHQGSFAVAALELGRFRELEGTLGQEGGERLLAVAAERISGALREDDTLAALGGARFALLLSGAADPAQVSAAVEAVAAVFTRPFTMDGHELYLTAGIGVAMYPEDGATPGDLFANAEAAAQRARLEGGQLWQFFHTSMNEQRDDRLRLEGELHRAVEREEFVVYYQPIVDAASMATGVEALLRWKHPVLGLVPPLKFIPVAEEIGLMTPIGAWVLRTACAQVSAWNRGRERPLKLAVNLSVRQLLDDDLPEAVARALEQSGLPAHLLELEITETAAMTDPERSGSILSRLCAGGVRIALDDFGTGYSSLSHLVGLPISTVKIDRSFVRELLTVPSRAAVVTSVVALGHRLGHAVVAEGVETEAERDYLIKESCDGLQGFLFSPPAPAAELAPLLDAGAFPN